MQAAHKLDHGWWRPFPNCRYQSPPNRFASLLSILPLFGGNSPAQLRKMPVQPKRCFIAKLRGDLIDRNRIVLGQRGLKNPGDLLLCTWAVLNCPLVPEELPTPSIIDLDAFTTRWVESSQRPAGSVIEPARNFIKAGRRILCQHGTQHIPHLFWRVAPSPSIREIGLFSDITVNHPR
jgi:hypothetical protein